MKVDDIEILKLIGNTPLYKLRTETGGADVWIKLEGSNPRRIDKGQGSMGNAQKS